MNESQAWTIKRLLDWTSEFFASHKTDSPRLAAEVLLAEALGCQRIELYTQFDREPDEAQRSLFREWVSRHAQGEPVAYLVGHREFYSLRFAVDASVLIPRPETEHLVSEVIQRAKSVGQESLSIADVGTGSGAIAIALAKHLPQATITAIDISRAALEVAKKNATSHQVLGQIQLIESDLFAQVPADLRFHFIVSNPPYIGQHERATVAENVLKYEPATALFAPGEDGTTLVRQLIQLAPNWLHPAGWLLIEVSPIISAQALEILNQSGQFRDTRLVKDLSRLDRVLIGQLAEKSD
ncbi:MAG TPA: peptide chain release factor N(5)-glutamine methyltransferase [Pirellulaceae bacterium]|nr:peptide chain release factor N(5)-glutamine methyltransferase [Pirellulaceae bacterium]